MNASNFERDAIMKVVRDKMFDIARRNGDVLSTFLHRLDCDSLPYSASSVSTTGSGPFDVEDFDEVLRGKGLKVYGIDPDDTADTVVLVVGRKDYEGQKLLELLDKRAGMNLKVYSQEMFVEYWASGRDPFDDEDYCRKLGTGHPALEFLSAQSFDWPSTVVYIGRGEFIFTDGHDGLLKYMGYKVGLQRVEQTKRRQILREVYASKLPPVHSPSYMDEWGEPKSKERLLKMANCIATFCCRGKRCAAAASDWEEDLEWLKQNYYSGRYRFQWPSYIP